MLYYHALEEFNKYIEMQKYKTTDDHILDLIGMKYIHSLEVVMDGKSVVESLDFNESFVDLVKICCLDHDIGRFEQAILTGNLSDFDLMNMIGLNHGGLGAKILKEGFIERQIPVRCFDSPIEIVVRNHVGVTIPPKDLLILSSNLLKTTDANYFFTNAPLEEKMKVINTITQIVQDVDRLDIYHQVIDGRYVPKKSDEKIDNKVFDMYYQGRYLNISEIKRYGLWNPNVGELVRLSFINQIKLLSVAKLIQKENIIMKMKIIRDNPLVFDAFEYAKEKLDEMINGSEDGIMVKTLKYD